MSQSMAKVFGGKFTPEGELPKPVSLRPEFDLLAEHVAFILISSSSFSSQLGRH